MSLFESRQTKVVTANPRNPREEDIKKAALAAKEGQPVVFPTDTVYGVGTNAFLPKAALEIFQVKDRPISKPLILLIADPEDAGPYVLEINELARELIDEYWPGPLTLILKKSDKVLPEVTAGGDTVGIRCPDHPVARMLIRLVGVALATTSANLAGQASPKSADEAKANLWGRVSYIIDGGNVKLGVESTVLDLSSDEPKLVREGYIPWAELKEKIKEVRGP